MPDQNEGALKFTRLEEYLREYKFDNAEEFMDAILAAYRRSDSFDFIGAGLGRIIFRGVDTDRFPIIPSAFRSVTDLREYQPYGFGLLANNSEQEDRKNFLFDHRERELRAIFHFLEYSDYLGIPTPLNYQSFALSYRQSLRLTQGVSLEYFDREPDTASPFPREEAREAFALAQHYGVPTRLLDWTESPLVAMFFAAASVWRNLAQVKLFSSDDTQLHSSGRHADDPGYICVYALGCQLIEKLKLSLVRTTRFQNPRLRAQKGLFLLDDFV